MTAIYDPAPGTAVNSEAYPPTANHDGFDSAGTGQIFRIGTIWYDTAAGRYYLCTGAARGAATWTPFILQSYPNYVTQTAAAVNAYVNGSTGSDSWDGLTAATPKRTLAAGLALIPTNITERAALHLRGTITGIGSPAFEQRIAGGVEFVVDGGTDVTAVSSTFAATGSSVLTLTVAGAGWTIDQWAGYLVHIATSPASGATPSILNQRRLIIGNTADTISVAVAWTVDPQAGTTFTVVRPSTEIVLGSPTIATTGGADSEFILENVYISGYGGVQIIGCTTAVTLSHVVIPDASLLIIQNEQVTLDYRQFNTSTWSRSSSKALSCGGVGMRGSIPLPAIVAVGSPRIMCEASYITRVSSSESGLFIHRGSRVGSLYKNAGGSGHLTFHPDIQDDFGSGYGHTYLNHILAEFCNIGFESGVDVSDSLGHGVELNHCFAVIGGLTGTGNAGAGVYAHSGTTIHVGGVASGAGGTLAGPSSGLMTYTSPIPVFGWADSGTITFTGSTSPANDGTFTVVAATSPTTILFINALGVAEPSAGTWILNSSTPTITGAGAGELSVDGSVQLSTWAAIIGGAPVADVTEMVVAKSKQRTQI